MRGSLCGPSTPRKVDGKFESLPAEPPRPISDEPAPRPLRPSVHWGGPGLQPGAVPGSRGWGPALPAVHAVPGGPCWVRTGGRLVLLHLETPSWPAHSSTTTSACISAARNSWAPNSCLQMVSLGHTRFCSLQEESKAHGQSAGSVAGTEHVGAAARPLGQGLGRQKTGKSRRTGCSRKSTGWEAAPSAGASLQTPGSQPGGLWDSQDSPAQPDAA